MSRAYSTHGRDDNGYILIFVVENVKRRYHLWYLVLDSSIILKFMLQKRGEYPSINFGIAWGWLQLQVPHTLSPRVRWTGGCSIYKHKWIYHFFFRDSANYVCHFQLIFLYHMDAWFWMLKQRICYSNTRTRTEWPIRGYAEIFLNMQWLWHSCSIAFLGVLEF
jgi:hypothetical protein